MKRCFGQIEDKDTGRDGRTRACHIFLIDTVLPAKAPPKVFTFYFSPEEYRHLVLRERPRRENGPIRRSTRFLQRINRFAYYNYSQMWIYALGVTLRQTLSSSSSSSPLDSVIMDNQQQPGNRRSSSSSSQEQLNGDYYQSDRQKTGSYSSCGINGRGRQREWDSNNDRKTNTPGE